MYNTSILWHFELVNDVIDKFEFDANRQAFYNWIAYFRNSDNWLAPNNNIY
jgi:hypothetical protein